MDRELRSVEMPIREVIGVTAGLYVPGGHANVLSSVSPDCSLFNSHWDGGIEVSGNLDWFKLAQRSAIAKVAEDAAVIHATTILDHSLGAWLLLGERSAGKSALAASWWKFQSGKVLADDYAVIKSGVVLVGPRLLPVRPNTARLLSIEVQDSCATLPHDVPQFAPIVGAVWLRTGPCAKIERLSEAHAQYEASRRTMGPTSPERAWAAVSEVPHFRLTRPFDSRHLEDSTTQLLQLLG